MVSSPLSYGFLVYNKNHCVKSTAWKPLRISAYSLQMRKNTDQIKLRIQALFMQWTIHQKPAGLDISFLKPMNLLIFILLLWQFEKPMKYFCFIFVYFFYFCFYNPPVPKPVSCGRQRVKDFHSAISISLTS